MYGVFNDDPIHLLFQWKKKKTCIKMWHCKALFYESVSLISALLGCSLYVTVYFIFISKFMCFGTPCIMQHLDF